MYSDLFSAESLADLQTVLPQIPFAIWETLYVTLLSTLLATVIGLPLGVLLVVGEKGGVLPLPKGVMHALNVLINLLRSIPFLILMIMVFPLSRLIIGTAVAQRQPSCPWWWRPSRLLPDWWRAASERWIPISSRRPRAWVLPPGRSSAG